MRRWLQKCFCRHDASVVSKNIKLWLQKTFYDPTGALMWADKKDFALLYVYFFAPLKHEKVHKIFFPFLIAVRLFAIHQRMKKTWYSLEVNVYRKGSGWIRSFMHYLCHVSGILCVLLRAYKALGIWDSQRHLKELFTAALHNWIDKGGAHTR